MRKPAYTVMNVHEMLNLPKRDVLSLVENGTLENMGTAENVLIDRASISKKFESELRAYEARALLTIDYQFTNAQTLELYANAKWHHEVKYEIPDKEWEIICEYATGDDDGNQQICEALIKLGYPKFNIDLDYMKLQEK